MSLINEALRKARQEAHRERAESRGLTVPMLGARETAARHRPLFVSGAVIVVLVGATALLALLASDGRKSALRETSGAAPAPLEAARPEAEKELDAQESAPVAAAVGDAPSEPETSRRDSKQPSRPGRSADNSQTARPAAAAVAASPPAATAAPQARDATPDAQPTTDDSSQAEPAPAAAAGSSPDVPLRVEAAAEPAADAAPDSYLRQADLENFGTFRLDGIAWSSERPFALVNGQVVGRGGTVDGARVVEVAPDSVLLELGQQQIRLLLR